MVAVAGSAGLSDQGGSASTGSSEPFTTERLRALQTLASGAVVRVTGEGCGAAAVGTGFAVDGALVTNSHIVSGASRVLVEAPSFGGWPLDAEVVRASSTLDLAEIKVGPAVDWSGLPNELALGAAVVGERVLFAGHSGGQQLRFVEATVHLVVPGDSYGIEGEVVLIDGASGPGFSGGPVLNRDGMAIAVLKGVDATTGLTVATSTAMLNQTSRFSNNSREEALCN
jgi:S1-C subfamily serine protease